MNHAPLGRTGLSVSSLGFGAAPIGYLETAQHEVERMVNLLLDAGVNVLDTAAAYAGSEEALGMAVGHRRGDYVLVSKCGKREDGLPGQPWSAERIGAAVDRTLKRLRTDHVDVTLLHSCSLEILKEGDAVAALARARDAGKTRFLGYSGDNEAAAYAATLPDVSVIETSVSICDQRNIDLVLPATRKHRVGVIAKRPLANTAWRPLDQLAESYQSYAAPYHDRFVAMGLSAEALGFRAADWPEIALRFTLSHREVDTAIVGTTRLDNARSNLVAASKGPLPEEIVGRLRAAFASGQARAGETWAGLT